MKKSLLLFFMLCIFHPRAYSQTLTASDCNPVIGNRFKICQPANFPPGPAGPGQSWDFVSLFCSSTTLNADTIIIPGSSVLSSFPGTTVVRLPGGVTGSARVPLKVGSAGIEKMGFYYPGDTTKYTNPETLIFYPLTYNSTASDSYYYKSIIPITSTTSQTVLTSGVKNFTVDASGIMASPEGNFLNVLRVYSRAIESRTVLPANTTNTSTKDGYSWYTAGIHDPILSIEINAPGTTNENQFTYYLFNHPNLVGISENELQKSVTIYPTPALNELTIETEHSGVISILNTFGEILMEVSVDNQKKIKLDVSSLSGGVYFVKILGNNKEPQLKKVIIEK